MTMRTFVVAAAAVVLLTQAASAQPIPGESPKEKAANELRQRELRDTEAKYQATMKRLPDAKKPADPWADVRAPGNTAAAKTK